jgi:hypothetical protein
LEDFSVTDRDGRLSTWKNGVFDLSGCKEPSFTRVTVNGKEYK